MTFRPNYVGINTATNRMNSAGWEYDLAGNMTRGQNADGVWQRYEYDAAGRLKRVLDDVGNWLQDNNYGSGRQRIFRNEPGGSGITWFVWGGDSVLAEYTSTSWGGAYTWSKSYIYAGSRLLFTATNNGAGGELKEYHHPDRLGTKLVTNNAANTSFEQSTLPFGTALNAESSGFSNQVFTSYERSDVANLDYAVNRTYSPGQGRFTTVDPIGMASASLGNPQSFNLYSYVQNNPIDFVDPSGLCPDGTEPMLDADGVMQCVGVGTPSVDINIGDDDDDGEISAGGVGISEQIQIDNPPTETEVPPGGGGGPTDGGGGGGGGGSSSEGGGGDAKDQCISNAIRTYAKATLQNIVLVEVGKGLVVGGIFLGRFFKGHAGKAPAAPGLPGSSAINITSSIKELVVTPGGLIGVGFFSIGYGFFSQQNAANDLVAELARCRRL